MGHHQQQQKELSSGSLVIVVMHGRRHSSRLPAEFKSKKLNFQFFRESKPEALESGLRQGICREVWGLGFRV